MNSTVTLGIIVGNRGFFPAHLCDSGRQQILEFQKLLRFICENGFEHHVAVNPTRLAAGVQEALSKYLEWEVYRHV